MIVRVCKYFKETLKYALRSYPVIYSYINKVEELYAMTPEELKNYKEKRFLEIFYWAYDKSPFYHKLYFQAGIKKEDIISIDDIKKLPVVTKNMVRQYADEILTVPRCRVIRANTSGTTGSPLKVYESWQSIWWSQAYIYFSRKKCGFKYGQPLVSLRGHLDRSLMHLKVHVSNTLYLSSYNINRQTVKFYYDLIVKFKPVAIEGYPSSLYSLALFLKDVGLKLYIPVTFTSSETLFLFQRKVIEEQLNTEIYDTYGMTEQTIRLVEAEDHSGYYETPGYSINEYLEDGEICTSLINKAFPLIRYRSNDIIEMAGTENCHLGVIIKSIEGRNEDYICCKDGSRIMRLDFLFKNVKHIKLSQLIQSNDGLLSICVVPEPEFEEIDKRQIERNLVQRVGNDNIDYCIKLIAENDIKYSARGKFKYIINLMNTGHI